jgi:cyclopropane fatty-acyl-phospholipid synthase-like methyltransferase
MNADNTKQFYEKYTDIYIKHFGNNFQVYSPNNINKYLNEQLKSMEVKDGMQLLDVGCGVCGAAVYFAKKKKISIDCINLSGYQIEIGIKNVEAAKLANRINIYEMDYHSLNKAILKQKYDIVYFFESLGHTTRYKEVIDGINSIVKLNGVLFIKDLFSLNSIENRHSEIAQLREDFFHYKPIDLHELLAVLFYNNFKVEFIKSLDFKLDNLRLKNFIQDIGLPDGGKETGYWLEIKAIKY